jgi:hypothetical protein
MTSTARLKRSLYGAQKAWKARKKKGPPDSSTRDMVAFATHVARQNPKAHFSTKAAKAQVARIARKTPQVMVKVSKGTFGAQHTLSNFTYMARNGKLPLYDQDGRIITDVDEMEILAEEWRRLNFHPDDLDTRASSPDARRLILSMPKDTDPETVFSAARATARHLFGERYDYVMALHSEEGQGKAEHPHVHLTVRARSHDGDTLEFRREDLQYMRRTFAIELRQRGIDADATPQIARGPRLNSEHIKVHKARRAVEEHNSFAPTDPKRFQRDVDRLKSGADRGHFDTEIVDLYAQVVRDLRASSDPSDKKLAAEFDNFLASSFGKQFRDRVPALEMQVAADALHRSHDDPGPKLKPKQGPKL